MLLNSGIGRLTIIPYFFFVWHDVVSVRLVDTSIHGHGAIGKGGRAQAIMPCRSALFQHLGGTCQQRSLTVVLQRYKVRNHFENIGKGESL